MIVPRETPNLYSRYLGLVQEWNGSINLVADQTIQDLESRHLHDSLQLLPIIRPGAKSLVDLGSGGGFPSIPLAIGRPEIDVYALESDKRKIAFLQYVKATLGLSNFHPMLTRIESWRAVPVDYVTARACARLEKLIAYAAPLMHSSTRCLFLKGRQHQEEIDEAAAHWHWDLVIHTGLDQSDSAIIDIGALSAKHA